MVTAREKAILRGFKKVTEKALKKQTQDGLAKVFNKLSCKGVAREIKAGRNVTGNAAYGIHMCVHDKIGPRVDVGTMKFYPMTKNAKRIERQTVKYVNLLLKNGGFRPMRSDLISMMAKKDTAFKKRVAKRRKRR